MNKHTPGPWKVGKPYGNKGIEIEGPDRIVAITWGVLPSSVNNAALLAAAPDLLAACEALVADWPHPSEQVVEGCRAAIAKAGGGQ